MPTWGSTTSSPPYVQLQGLPQHLLESGSALPTHTDLEKDCQAATTATLYCTSAAASREPGTGGKVTVPRHRGAQSQADWAPIINSQAMVILPPCRRYADAVLPSSSYQLPLLSRLTMHW